MKIFNYGNVDSLKETESSVHWTNPSESKLEEFDTVVKLIAENSEVNQVHVAHAHSDVINFAILANRDLSPKNWEHYRESRRAQTFFIPEQQFNNGKQNPFERPNLEGDFKNFEQSLRNGRTRYTSVPKYHVDEFGNRQSRSCNNDLKNTSTGTKSLAFFGCSFTYGDCIEGDDIYVNKVADGFSTLLNEPVTAYNLAYGGNSIESIRQQFQTVVALRSFTYAFFLLPTINRFNTLEVGKNGDYLCNIIRNMSQDLSVIRKITVIPTFQRKLLPSRTQMKIESTNLVEEIYRAADNIKMILTLCKLHNIKPILTAWDRETYSVIAATVDDPSTQLAPFFQFPDKDKDPMDFGIDGAHPGPIAHDVFAKTVNNWLAERKI